LIFLNDLITFLLGTFKHTIAFDVVVSDIVAEAISTYRMEALVYVSIPFDVVEFDWTIALRISAIYSAAA
jgi:hypothetical protein